ncbi:polyphenol oxidase family protein [Bifidobacterium sp.]|uniref:polyphenol oxidase family protein n=1 Tax=Bifidobacterium sp. TaxID=41200 RepID=UPI0025BA2761|nr:polyphenol oxidase family protein [Bifidobacterium sp.]MCH4209059.1 polyphenol oxidase family protein [Bifidobacterium sp.]MCI1225336.1 polyphenol oxidase family protein [Bifidobacterium sp.]
MTDSSSATHGSPQFDDAILDSSAMSPTDSAGNPIPVTIPIDLAPGVKVVYTTRLGGVSEGDWGNCNYGGKGGEAPELVEANRVALAKELHADLSLVSQTHSGIAVDMDEHVERNAAFGIDVSGTVASYDGTGRRNVSLDQYGSGVRPAATALGADAQVTTRTGLALGMFAADCMPVLFADPEHGVIGAAHCGRGGLLNGVIGSCVRLMVSKGAQPQHIVATLGPRICADCYEVGGEIADDFDAHFPGSYSLTRFSGPGVDLAAAALQELAAAGIPRDNIIDSRPRVAAATEYLREDEELIGLCLRDDEDSPRLSERIAKLRHPMCTFENPLWYSHRRSSRANKAHEGRMLGLIVLSR